MYYVLQVAPGLEDQTERLIKNTIKAGVYERCFHPMRRMQKKIRGSWKDLHEKLLPGYVFITSSQIGELYEELKRVPVLTKLLGKDGECFPALCEEEVQWLEQMEGGTLEVGLSQVTVEQDEIRILSGPLKNVEGKIKKIHLHKRTAAVEVDFLGRKRVVYLGIEIIERVKV